MGIANLNKVKKLNSLYVVGAGDEELKRLTLLSKIQALNLDMNTVSPPGMECLSAFSGLEVLSLTNSTTVTDEPIRDTSHFSKVRNLNLNGASITDAGLTSLATLVNLKDLRLSNTRVTKSGVGKLHQALPSCTIMWNEGVIWPESP